MLTCTPITSVGMAESYYQRDDYYMREHKDLDRWHGKLAQKLGFEGEVKAEDFNTLLSQSGARTNGVKAGKQPTLGIDMTFSCPKSLSLAQAESEDMQQRIDRAYDRSIQRFADYIEQNYIYTRSKHGGKKLVKGHGMVASFHNHDLSRAEQLDKHVHMFLHSMTETEDGRIRTIAIRHIMQHQKELGGILRGILAEECRKEGLHPVVTNEKDGTWELEGYDRETIELMSARRAEILAELERRGADPHDAKQAQFAQMATREKKNHAADLEAIKRETHDFLESRNVHAAVYAGEEIPSLSPSVQERIRVINDCISELQEKEFSFTADELQQLLCQRGGFYGVDLKEAKNIIRRNDRLVRVQDKKTKEISYTTKENIQREREISEMWNSAKGRYRSTVLDSATAERVLDEIVAEDNAKKKPGERKVILAEEQRKMILHCCTTNENCIVNGSAGTGKTFALQYVRKVLEHEGVKVSGSAFTGKASDGLKFEANIVDSRTMDSLMVQAENESLRNQGIKREREIDFNKKTSFDFSGLVRDIHREARVMVLDEAGMCSDQKMHEFMRLAEIKNWRLILAGDVEQYKPIGAGQPMKMLIDEGAATAYMQNIQRQAEKENCEAAKEFVKEHGSTDKAIDFWQEKGYIQECEDAADMQKKCIADYLESNRSTAQKLILTDTNAERVSVNEQIRQKLVERGDLKEGREFEIADPTDEDQDHTSKRIFSEGQRIIFTRNGGSFGLNVSNGTMGTIESIDGDNMRVNVGKPDKPQMVEFSMKNYNAIDSGFCVTGMKSQGMSVPEVFSLNRSRSISLNHAAFYVNTTRFINDLHVYTDDLQHLKDRVRTAVDKLTKLNYERLPENGKLEHTGYRDAGERAEDRMKGTSPLPLQERLRRMQITQELGREMQLEDIPAYDEPQQPKQTNGKMSSLEKSLRQDIRDELRIAELEKAHKLRQRLAGARETSEAVQEEAERFPTPQNRLRARLAAERVDGMEEVERKSTELERTALKDTARNMNPRKLLAAFEAIGEDDDKFLPSRERCNILVSELELRDPIDLQFALDDEAEAVRVESYESLSETERPFVDDLLEDDTLALSPKDRKLAKKNLLFGRDRAGGLHVLPFSQKDETLKSGMVLSFRKFRGMFTGKISDKSLASMRTSIFHSAVGASARHLTKPSIAKAAGKSMGGAIPGATGKANKFMDWMNPRKSGTENMKDGAKKMVGAVVKTPINIVADIIRNPILGILTAPIKLAQGVAKMGDGAMGMMVGAAKGLNDEKQRVRTLAGKEKKNENEAKLDM